MGDRCSPGGPGDQEAEATVRIVKESRAEERAERGNYQRIIETREGSKEIRKSREGRKKRFSRRVARLRPRGRPRSMSLPWRPGPAPWCSTTDYLCQRFLPLSSPSPYGFPTVQYETQTRTSELPRPGGGANARSGSLLAYPRDTEHQGVHGGMDEPRGGRRVRG